MIPLTLAYEIKDEIYRYLKVLWEIKANKSGKALEKYYREDNPLVKGPFIQLRLPYEPTENIDDIKLKIKPKFNPYKHQKNAFDRLYYKEAKNTVVTTGTGSGKTECFMYPVLDYVKAMKDEGKKGVKAIILYPMNALLDDQAKRFCEELKDQGLEDLNIRVGKYTGNQGTQKHMDYDNFKVINDRNVLTNDPPDILMTNYKMLDYMLFREKEKTFWSENTQDVLKYLVLDEMHTFDGASGADVACLIRRLKMVALKERSSELVCVGTSATLSSSPDAKGELCVFASSLFGSEFSEDAIVGEIKHTAKSYLGNIENKSIPREFETKSLNIDSVAFKANESVDKYIQKSAKIFGFEELLNDPCELAKELSKLEIVHLLVEATDRKGMKSVDDLFKYFEENHSNYIESCGALGFKALVTSVVTLCSYARSPLNKKFPFLTIKCSLWTQEMKRVLKKVVNEDIGEPLFIDEDSDMPKSEKVLPAIYCTFCGEAGWLTTHEDIDEDRAEVLINFKPREIGQASMRRKAYALFPFNEKHISKAYYFYPREDKLFKKEQSPVEGLSDELNTAIRLIKVSQVDGYCPCCDTKFDSRAFSASSTQLTSLIAEEFFANPLNEDKKMISFSDSVQDATFNAANINDRTYKFTLKRFIEKKLTEGKSLTEVCNTIIDKAAIRKMTPHERTELVGKYIPEKMKKKWQINKADFNFKKSEYSLEMIDSLVDVISHDVFGQFTFEARLGWSFENIGHSGFYLSEADWNDLFDDYQKYFEKVDHQDILIGDVDIFKGFLLGIIQRFKHQGIVYSRFLDAYYNDSRADYYPSGKRYPDLDFFSMKKNQPMFFTTNIKPVYGAKRRTFQGVGKGQSWYYRWVKKHAEVTRVHELYEGICSLLTKKGVLLAVGEGVDRNGPRFVLNPEKLLYTKNVVTSKCNQCQHVHTVAEYLKLDANGIPCHKSNCNGVYELIDNSSQKKYFESYYAVEPYRINAFEHTGSLDSKIKEFVEDEFKAKESSTPSHDINYLSCTPTMEMGIDIGNLSSVLLKAVPRNAASYLQRVGRSGRTSGNSLDFLVIDKNPHNLYFWANPYKLLNWDVVSPACRYKTGHILKRQYNAYCLDQFLHQDVEGAMVKDIPGTLGWIFKDDEASSKSRLYWKSFYKFVSDNQKSLFDTFVTGFNLKAGEHALSELSKYTESNLVKSEFEGAFESFREYITDLKDEVQVFKLQIEEFRKEDKSFFEKIEKGHKGEEGFDLEEILNTLPEESQDYVKKYYADYRSAQKKIKEFGKKSLLGVLADKGILPGYAFPESGCELEISVKKPVVNGINTSVKDIYHKIEVTRSAETAIRELAPFNTFYTHGFKGKVDRLGLYGKKDAVVDLGICDNCGHVSKKKLCEVCGDLVELDKVYDFKKAISSNDFNSSYIEGFADRRDRKNYDVSKHFLFDAKIHDNERHRISYVNKELNFGFEFQSNIEIITLNNGQRVFGKDAKGFKVCVGCGAVENPQESKQRQKKGLDVVSHFKNCPAKAKPLTEIKLHRKIKSDAIRFTMPSAIFEDTLMAILYLGIKIHLKGDTGHIKVGSYQQGEGQYLVIFDDVPGGTGHLRDFLKISLDQNASSEIVPKTFFKVLKDVKETLEKCPCENGCYSCLWGAHNAVRRDSVSKQTAFIWLNRILSGKESDFQRKEDLGLYNISEEQSFDGQTEIIFYQILEYLSQNLTLPAKAFDLKPVAFSNDKQSAEIIMQGKKIIIESSPYKKVDLKESGIYTKPDFTLYNEDGSYAGFIYTDGRDPHLSPGEEEPTFVNDIKLRDELFKQEKVPVFTFTYNMLQELWDRISKSKTLNEEHTYKLSSSDYENHNGVMIHDDLSKHSLVSIVKMLEVMVLGDTVSKDEGTNYQKLVFEYKNNNMFHFDSVSSTFNLKTGADVRCEKNNDNLIITESYEQHWSNFWYIFNMYTLIGKVPLKFKINQ